MEQLVGQLSRQETEEFTRLHNSQNGLQESTLQLCLDYYLQYRSHAHVPLVALRSRLMS